MSTNSCLSSCNGNKDIYIYNIPSSTLQQLCNYLDGLNVWKQLAEFVCLKPSEVQNIQREHEVKKRSPSELLLSLWGNQYNHTVTELFVVLQRLELFPGMRILKDLVPRKHHIRIPNSQPKLSSLLIQDKFCANNQDESKKILNCSIFSDTSDSNNDSEISEEQQQPVQSLQQSSYPSSLLEISYHDLTEATDKWNENRILGKGGFGTVFYGKWKHIELAIKQIHNSGHRGEESTKLEMEQILNELKCLDSCRHVNVLPLYGYNLSGDKPCLVYEYMVGNTLDYRLYSKRVIPLTWQQRLNICFGTARGIYFLHTCREIPLIHGDIKPQNILLDQCLQPRIGDFGLAREGPNSINSSIEVSKVYGTKPYLPREFVECKKLSTKVDIYSFGVVLLEVYTGLRAHDKYRTSQHIVKYCNSFERIRLPELIDSNVPRSQIEHDKCLGILQLGLACTVDQSRLRPEMEHIVQELDNFRNFVYGNVY